MGKLQLTINKEKLESVMTREFNASRADLWKAHTDPELMKQWWGSSKYTTIIDTYEPKSGGKWKMVHEGHGEKYVFFGEFREIVEPEKITWTFNFEPFPNSEIVETFYFEELSEGKTRLRTVSHYPTLEAFEQMIQSGMEEGANETWDRLAELVEK